VLFGARYFLEPGGGAILGDVPRQASAGGRSGEGLWLSGGSLRVISAIVLLGSGSIFATRFVGADNAIDAHENGRRDCRNQDNLDGHSGTPRR